MFMNTTLQAAVHLGKDDDTNLHFAKNHIWDSLGHLFGEIKRPTCELSEILGPKTPEIVGLKIIEFEETTKRSISLSCEKTYQITPSQVYVFSDSVLCMGEMRSDPNAAWMTKIKWYSQNNHLQYVNRMDGMQTEFEWKIFPEFTTSGILEEIQKFIKVIQCEPEHFNGRIIFLSMFDDIMWRENDNTEECNHNAIEVGKYARRFPRGHWSFLGPGQEKTWYKTCSDKPNREWDKTAAMMILQVVTEFAHPVLRASSAFERGKSDMKEYGKSSRFDDNEGNIEMLLHTVISVNLLSIYGSWQIGAKTGQKLIRRVSSLL